MATKKKATPKETEAVWYVESLQSGQKIFYSAAKKLGNAVVYRGGYWDTHKEAQDVADMLNKEGK